MLNIFLGKSKVFIPFFALLNPHHKSHQIILWPSCDVITPESLNNISDEINVKDTIFQKIEVLCSDVIDCPEEYRQWPILFFFASF